MQLTRISCMQDGASVFEDIEIELIPSGSIGSLSKHYPVSSVVFRETPHDYDWHPAPHRQYIVLPDGEVEIETGMAEKRRFRGGDILLLEDTWGSGQRTRTGGNENDLIPLAKTLLPDANLPGLRGKVLENGAPRFFRRLEEGFLDIEDWRTRSAEVADFINAEALEYGFDALGYSTGANFATGLLLRHPGVLARAVLLRPMFVSQAHGKPKLMGKLVLINFGQHDPFLGDGDMEHVPDQFRSAGANVDVRIEDAGHGLGPGDVPVVKAWLEKRGAL